MLYDKYRDNINYKNSEKVYELSDKTSGFISEIVRGIKDIKILNAEESFLEEADKYMNNANTVRLKSNITDEKLSTISSIISELSKSNDEEVISKFIIELCKLSKLKQYKKYNTKRIKCILYDDNKRMK